MTNVTTGYAKRNKLESFSLFNYDSCDDFEDAISKFIFTRDIITITQSEDEDNMTIMVFYREFP